MENDQLNQKEAKKSSGKSKKPLQKNSKNKRKKNKKDLSKNGIPRQKIPKECLENALKVINDPENVVWKDRSTACEKCIHKHQELTSYLSNPTDILNWDIQLRYARDCLVRRDWQNLAEILLLFKPQRASEHIFPIFAKYASICLAYTNEPLLKSWLQSFGCNQSTNAVLQKWTDISKSTDEADSIQIVKTEE